MQDGEDGFDLYWNGRKKPTFHWQPNSISLLATPTEKNIAALFDVATDAGICNGPIEIFGDAQFQCLAVAEAVRRGITINIETLADEAKEVYKKLKPVEYSEKTDKIRMRM